eukprot:CAMPEP_0178959720 /NCGR_PEP_ID=MMETSP0789-20121207/12474_1 /TAXON_ID=3005 /ORGANISM="Rhizosolenia setigera, Strain CCMP 1694" /LENGTH=307 /DNA_ID=CAMNT_0020642807 /DNA_START=105 /DNA_END=1028 /DNA_ORIENTATION=-
MKIPIVLLLLKSFADGMSVTMPSKVLVTGAAGRTGRLVFSLLNEDSDVNVVGLLRSEKSAIKLRKDTKCGLDQLVVADVTDDEFYGNIPKVLEGSNAMIICTSAVPVISKSSMFKTLLKVPLNLITGKKPFNFRSLRFKFKKNQYPEIVDYEGQKRQIDLAKKLGINHVIVVSSMGGTDPSNFLNSIGKNADGSGNGDILLFKRKAEKYLVESGLGYTIIHPGGLRDTPDTNEEILIDVNDELLKNEKKSINRLDVAKLCVAAVKTGSKNASLDCVAFEVDEGTKPRSAAEVLEEFFSSGKTYDYSL